MIISITGTPGTGKTTVAKLLASQLSANLIAINKLIAKKHYRIDKKRKTKIVDIKALQNLINKKIVKNKINIIEGHLSHLISADFIIILRTNPLVLKKRLLRKKWPQAKIRENVQAEILDVITIQATQRHRKHKIFELDTSRVKPKSVVNIIAKLLNNHLTGKYGVGKIDWSEKYKNELMV